MSGPFAIVTTALGDAEAAKALAHALVEARLAACVQIMPIESVYRWQGAIEHEAEHLLVCKIVAADFAAVEAAIKTRHGYDVPEIVMTPIDAGHAPYLDWIAASCRRPGLVSSPASGSQIARTPSAGRNEQTS